MELLETVSSRTSLIRTLQGTERSFRIMTPLTVLNVQLIKPGSHSSLNCI